MQRHFSAHLKLSRLFVHHADVSQVCLFRSSALDENSSAITLGTEGVDVGFHLAEPIEFAFAKQPARTFCCIACQASTELAEASEIVFVPIAKATITLAINSCSWFYVVFLVPVPIPA